MKIKTKNAGIVLMLIYSFFYQAFFTSAIIKYSLFAMIFGLLIRNVRRIKLLRDILLWIAFVSYMVVTSKTVGDVPITFACIVIMGVLATGDNSWDETFIHTIAICTGIHAIITIACCIVPSLHSSVIVPVFFPKLAGRVEMTSVAGFTNHYSSNGMYLGIGFTIAAINAICCPRHKKRKAYLWAVVVLIALILTTKRTHLVAGVLAVLIVYIIMSKQRGETLSGYFKAVSILIVSIGVFTIAAQLIPSLGTIVNRFVELGEDDTMHGRTYFYEIAYQNWLSNPIFGTGWGGFSNAFNQTKLGQAYISNGYGKIQPHNVYLQLLSDLGIVGLLLFLFLVISAFKSGIKKAKEYQSERSMYCCLGILIFWLICGITGNPLNDVQLFCPFVLACMLIISNNRVRFKR